MISQLTKLLNKKDESIYYKNQKTYQIPNKIKLINVNFAYKNSKQKILDNINFKINSGNKVGIFGTTGSGKTTLLDVLMGLLKPTKGKILVNHKDLYSSSNYRDVIAWRRSIALVPQSIFLIDSTIEKNISFSVKNEDINLGRIKEVVRIAQLSDFVKNSPNGLNTKVGERGIKLSGGQRQRIGLARAIYKNCPVLVLDEATSALDNKTEKKVIDSILKFNPNLIIIMVAHRLSTIKTVTS